jgi:transposase InsO family protein
MMPPSSTDALRRLGSNLHRLAVRQKQEAALLIHMLPAQIEDLGHPTTGQQKQPKRASRFVHQAVKDDETTASAVAFLEEALAALPFQVTHVLTDRGSCFTADAFEHACQRHGVAHRKTRPYTPRTNGLVERFNGRVQREVLGITIYSHRDLETVLAGFNVAYNARRQRVLKGRSPDAVLREHLAAKPKLANPLARPPDPEALPRALQVIASAKDVSHPGRFRSRVSWLGLSGQKAASSVRGAEAGYPTGPVHGGAYAAPAALTASRLPPASGWLRKGRPRALRLP